MQIGIFDENDPLKTAVTWGPVGAEAVLSQFYPPHISLFLDDMDVIKARNEALSYAATLNAYGVKTFFARDILAENLKPISLSFDAILSILIQKADDIKSKYRTVNHKNYKEILEVLLKLDIERYGSNRAFTLNWKLSLFPQLPLGNLIYSRDQMNVIFTKRVRSHMKKEIRRPEVELYETVYEKLTGDNNSLVLPLGETFEGGDSYIHDNTIYIGIGTRTSIGAAFHIYRALEKEIEKKGFKFAMVVDMNAENRDFREQMLFMHLDTFSNPVGKNQIAVCLPEAKRRKVKLIETISGQPTIIDTGLSFLDFLFREGQEIVSIPEEEQQSFGCNFLSIDNNTILVPLNTNKKTIEGLINIGKKVKYVHLDESTKGFGAAHCMTGQLLRQS